MSLQALLALTGESEDPLEQLRRIREEREERISRLGNLIGIPGGLALEDTARLGLAPAGEKAGLGRLAGDLATRAVTGLGEAGGFLADLPGQAMAALIPRPAGVSEFNPPTEEFRESLSATREKAQDRLMGTMSSRADVSPVEMAFMDFATDFAPDVGMGLGGGGRRLARQLGRAATYEAPDLAPAFRSLGREVADSGMRRPSALAERSLAIEVPEELARAGKSTGKVSFDPPVGKDVKTIAMRNEAGEEVGHIRVKPEGGNRGFHTDWVEVDPEYRGKNLSRDLYGKAESLYGPRLGATVGQTPAGKAAVESFEASGLRNAEKTGAELLDAADSVPAGTSPAQALPELTLRDSTPARFIGWLRDRFESFGQYGTPSRRFVAPEVRKFIRHHLPRKFEQSQNEEKALLLRVQRVSQKVEDAVRGASDRTGEGTLALRRQVDAARRAGDLSQIQDPELQGVAREAGEFIDDLSRRMIDSGMLTEKTADTFKANLGSYLNRSYEAFDVQGFREAVKGRPQWDAAFAWMRDRYPQKSEDEIVGILYQLTDREKGALPAAFGSRRGMAPRKDLTELMHRKDVPEPIADLMGVRTDFRANFERSAAKMAHDLAVHETLTAVAEEGKRLGIFQDAPRGDFYRRLGGGKRRSPLDDLHTIPELENLLNKIQEVSRPGWFAYLSGLTKFGKVGFSPQTQMRNWESGFLMSLANGRLFAKPKYFAQAAKVSASSIVDNNTRALRFLGIRDQAGLHEAMVDATRYGVLGTGANTGEFLSYVRAVSSKGGKVGRKLGEAGEVVGRAYRMGDDFWKFFNWRQEVDELAWAHAGGPSPVPLEAIKREAAELVNQQLQTYSRSAPLARTLSRNPVIGAFTTFFFEMPRNLVNIARRSAYEVGLAVRTQNPRFAALAAKRMTGMGAALTVWGAWKLHSETELGITSEQEEAFRHLAMRPWDKNSQPVFVERKGSKWAYLDSQFADPYNVVQRAWVGMLARPGSLEERLGRFASEVASTYAGPELLATAVGETAFNQRMGNLPFFNSAEGQIRNPTDPVGQQVKDVGYHLYRGVAPGGVISGERILRGAGVLDRQAPTGGRDYELTPELVALVGPRRVDVDISDQLRRKIYEWNDQRQEVSALYNRRMKKAQAPAERLEVKDLTHQAWRESYEWMLSYVDDARVLGMSRGQILRTLRENGVSERVSRALLRGQFMSYEQYRSRD